MSLLLTDVNRWLLQEEDERQQQLRERARKLIAEARQGLVTTPTPTSDSTGVDPSRGTGGVGAGGAGAGGGNLRSISHSSGSPSPTESFQKFLSNGAGKLQSFKMTLVDKAHQDASLIKSKISFLVPSGCFAGSL